MPTTDPVYEADPSRCFHASQFIECPKGRVCAVWAQGIPTLLPACTHVALVSMANYRCTSIMIVPKEDLARLAKRWWHPQSNRRVRIEQCSEAEWDQLVARAAGHAVDRATLPGGLSLN